jgi:hypothetical protein
MPIAPTYPGVYIEEVPSAVRTIVGVATSITAFIGRALRGAVNDPVRIQSFADFERKFGGLWQQSTMSYAVRQYFLNGGTDAIIVRVHNYKTVGEDRATISLAAEAKTLTLIAANEGEWGNNLQASVDHQTRDVIDTNLFNLVIQEVDAAGNVVQTESHRNVSIDEDDATYLVTVLEQSSNLVRVQDSVPTERPDETTSQVGNGFGSDGNPIEDADITGSQSQKTGIYALEDADLFNLLCIPPLTRTTDVDSAVWSDALAYCKDRRAMLIVDPPASPSVPDWDGAEDAVNNITFVDSLRDENACIFFPRIKAPDPLKENRLQDFAPCGAVAGIFARTDAARGVWKAPAGIEATLAGVRGLTYKMTDGENGQLNPLGVNCLRSFPIIGNVVWGSRTLEGADQLASQWKYTPVRRVALYIEESLYRGTQWVVFEPNDEPLWAQIRLNVGSFMQGLFRQGAFQGKTPREAYFVKCDKETTTQDDINRGIVNILVGFAPLKPAEFVIIKISQIAGETQA